MVGERAEDLAEELVGRERRGAVVDELHAEEQKAEPEDRLTNVARGAAPGNIEEPAGEDDKRGDPQKVERQELDGDRGADVGAEDHADRLAKRQ